MNGLFKVLCIDNGTYFSSRVRCPIRRHDLNFRLACINSVIERKNNKHLKPIMKQHSNQAIPTCRIVVPLMGLVRHSAELALECFGYCSDCCCCYFSSAVYCATYWSMIRPMTMYRVVADRPMSHKSLVAADRIANQHRVSVYWNFSAVAHIQLTFESLHTSAALTLYFHLWNLQFGHCWKWKR